MKRDTHGSPINRRAIQLGIKGTFVERYNKDWVDKFNLPYIVNLK